MKREASTVWNGGLRDGRGTISTGSGVLRDTQYAFVARFENGVGTDPEELTAATRAGCFSMALSAQLGEANVEAERVATSATVTLEKTGDGFSIAAVHLDLRARVPGASREAFEQAADSARAGCQVSRLINARITLSAELEA